MKRIKQFALSSSLPLFAIILLRDPETSSKAIASGLSFCAGSVLSTLFPLFVISELWINLGFSNKISRLLEPLMTRAFHMPGETASAFLLGAIGGYPLGAKTICQLYKDNILKKQEAEYALFFCCNAGPAFLIGVIGVTLFQSILIGSILWGLHLMSAILTGILFRPQQKAIYVKQSTSCQIREFLPALTASISNGGKTTIQVCMFILFFSILTEYFHTLLPASISSTLLLASMELAGGCLRLGSAGLSQEIAFVLCSGLVGWGGLCVHCQTMTLLFDVELSSRHYWFGKTLHALCSTAIACLIVPFLPLQITCFAGTLPPINEISLLGTLLFLLFLKTSTGKMKKNRI